MASLETDRMRAVIQGQSTVSDKIRALDAAGFARADIARFLGKRYQHVRNVLVAGTPAAKNPPRATSTADPVDRPARQLLKGRLQIGAGGRIVIPAEMRAAMGVSEGDSLLARVIDGELRLLSQDAALQKAQALVRQVVPEGVSLVDELIAERRLEARRDDER
ncbi:AbrB/MazE/SpoVT family DNA-binding domain-containing protein [Nitratireductor alexandrii]|uniref:AbrB/MazE/SpoVT family DNA-binding domain-containing protein n=1 Tax=Nitratireductor alexandrii TaxID=2448161 RepID=UPI001EE8A6A3|nr:AbrB/MazE/SpoVT family DNA-binding domain-containing protein [Nitratireductor alexandrii]